MSDLFYIHTFGCQMNKHDSERIAGHLNRHGYRLTMDIQQADIILVNTCYVREKAMTKVYAYLGRLKRMKQDHPGTLIGVCGCGAQGEGTAFFERMPFIDFLVGPQEIPRIPELLATVKQGQTHQAALHLANENLQNLSDQPLRRDSALKAWVTIMEGCDNFCSYCVVPYVRGRERSRQVVDILHEVQDLVSRGYKDITLLGQNVNSYHDTTSPGFDFPDLLTFLVTQSDIRRLRFVTSHPKDLDHKLIQVMADFDVICNHLHLPVQSGSNRILKAMNRKYSIEHYLKIIAAVRQKIPDISLTTDIIVGFPDELEADFQATEDLLRQVAYDTAFIFYYQQRQGTAAAALKDNVPSSEKMRRLQRLVELQNHISTRQLGKLLHQTVEILVEGRSKRGENLMMGRTRTNKIIHYSGSEADVGQELLVRVEQVFPHSARGSALESPASVSPPATTPVSESE